MLNELSIKKIKTEKDPEVKKSKTCIRRLEFKKLQKTDPPKVGCFQKHFKIFNVMSCKGIVYIYVQVSYTEMFY